MATPQNSEPVSMQGMPPGASADPRGMWELYYIYYFLKRYEDVLEFQDIAEVPPIEIFENAIEDNTNLFYVAIIKILLCGIVKKQHRSRMTNWETILQKVLHQNASPFWQISPLEQESAISSLRAPGVSANHNDGSHSNDEVDHSGEGNARKRKALSPSLQAEHPISQVSKRTKLDDDASDVTSHQIFYPIKPQNKKFSQLDQCTKVRILASLVEWNYDQNQSITDSQASFPDPVSLSPLGHDKWGNAYWFFGDHRLYKECPARFDGHFRLTKFSSPPSWSVVATDMDSWSDTVNVFRTSRNSDEKKLLISIENQVLPSLSEKLALRPCPLVVGSSPVDVDGNSRSTRRGARSIAKGEANVLSETIASNTAESVTEQHDASPVDAGRESSPEAAGSLDLQHEDNLPLSATAGMKRKVGRPPKSTKKRQPLDTADDTKPPEAVAERPVELSSTGRPIRARHRSKFADDFIQDFGDRDDVNERVRKPRSGPALPQTSPTRQPLAPNAAGENGPPNLLSASTLNAADVLQDLKQQQFSPAQFLPGFPAISPDYQMLLQQHAAYYQNTFSSALAGLQYTPQSAALAQMYMTPYSHVMVSPAYYMATMSPDQGSVMAARQNSLTSSDFAASALAQFTQLPTSVSNQLPLMSMHPLLQPSNVLSVNGLTAAVPSAIQLPPAHSSSLAPIEAQQPSSKNLPPAASK